MPRDRAINFSDLIGKFDLLRVTCAQSGRDGNYRLNGLIEKRGRDGKVIDLLDESGPHDPCWRPVPGCGDGAVK
jgi:hypothetical protein